MTTSELHQTAQLDSHRPTAADMAQATPIVTIETVLVCGGVTTLLFVVANVVGLVTGLIITALVIRGNWQVRRMSIQNAIDDRLEREGQR